MENFDPNEFLENTNWEKLIRGYDNVRRMGKIHSLLEPNKEDIQEYELRWLTYRQYR